MLSLPSIDEVDAHLAQASLREFIKLSWPIVEPGTTYKTNWHIDAMCEYLEAATRREFRRLIINVPPRTSKSRTVSVMWPAWVWLREPSARWLFASYSNDLALEHSEECRLLIESQGGREDSDGTLLEHVGYTGLVRLLGGRWTLAPGANLKSRFRTTERGFRMATSVTSKVTGFGGDFIVADDPHNAQEAESDVIRANVLRWWDRAISSRMNDPKRGVRVVVMQRLHEGDLTGHLVAKEAGYEHLCLPMEYEPTHPFVWPHDPRTEPGEKLWPEHMDDEVLTQFKLDQGAYAYAGQYQQRPAPDEGGLFKRANFRYWEWADETTGILRYANDDGHDRLCDLKVCSAFMTMDVAATEKEMSDYTVVSTWAKTPWGDLLLLDVAREKMNTPEQPAWAEAQFVRAKRWGNGPVWMGVERATYGLALIQQLKKRGKLPVKELIADRDKVSRAATIGVFYEGHRVFHPVAASWLQAFEDELLVFPNGMHDDQVDTAAYAGLEYGNVAVGSVGTGEGDPSSVPITRGIQDGF